MDPKVQERIRGYMIAAISWVQGEEEEEPTSIGELNAMDFEDLFSEYTGICGIEDTQYSKGT